MGLQSQMHVTRLTHTPTKKQCLYHPAVALRPFSMSHRTCFASSPLSHSPHFLHHWLVLPFLERDINESQYVFFCVRLLSLDVYCWWDLSMALPAPASAPFCCWAERHCVRQCSAMHASALLLRDMWMFLASDYWGPAISCCFSAFSDPCKNGTDAGNASIELQLEGPESI